jgi:glycosyltransferase involved in cell wall biosynthesis
MPSNGGAIIARNTGMSMASGEFIAVMDADDVCLPQRLERQVEFMRRAPQVGVLGAFVQIIDDQGRPGTTKTYPSGRGADFLVDVLLQLLRASLGDDAALGAESGRGYALGCKGGAEDYDLFQRLNGL